MIISLNWIKKYTKVEKSVDDLKTLIGSRLVEVESVRDLNEIYKDVVVAKVIKSQPIPDSNHLNLVLIDDGGFVKSVKRDDKNFVQVVCGASNVRENMFVAWLPPESIVPATFGKKDEFKLSVKNLRGHVSNGMLASAKELGLSDDHSGIFEISENVSPGDSFAKLYELNDILLDIENKSLTHRPDTFGIIGFAREVSAIQGIGFRTPDFLRNVANIKLNGENKINIIIEAKELSAQYSAVVLSEADAKLKSPSEVQMYLSRVGVRSVNAIVDVTNYLMMLTGQPLHTFDYDKIIKIAGDNPTISVRKAKSGEKTILLDGRDIELNSEDIVIDAGGVIIGLAGAMGSKNTSVDDQTRNILLESATFNLYNLRTTQMRHGIFSEALTRFTKGQPSALGLPVLYEAIKLLGQWSNAKVISQVFVEKGFDDSNKTIELEVDFINQTLGTLLEKKDIIKILEDTEFTIIDKGKTIEALAPYWRTDIKIPEDIVEEIGRIHGFDNIVPTLPKRKIQPVNISSFDRFKQKLRTTLKSVGANEVYLYSFVHGNTITKNNQSTEDSYKVTNAISPDLQYYRQSLLPSLLGVVRGNIKQGFEEFGIYEINKVHNKKHGINSEKVPIENDSIGFVYANKNTSKNSPYYVTKKYLDFVFKQIGVDYKLLKLEKNYEDTRSNIFEISRSAVVKSGSKHIGYIGEFKKEIIERNKLPDCSAGFELNTKILFESIDKTIKNYKIISKYPKIYRDICFQVDAKISYSDLIECLNSVKKNIDVQIFIEPIDFYQQENSNLKNITMKFVYQSMHKTLTNDEANSISQKFIDASMKSLGAKII